MDVNENGLISLDTFACGDALLKFNRELKRVAKNILDPNTAAKKKRSITLKIEFSPDDLRSNLVTSITCTSKIVPESEAQTLVYLARNPATGEICMNEYSSMIPGQTSLNEYGTDQEGNLLMPGSQGGVIDYREIVSSEL